MKKEVKFMKELPQSRIDAELSRKVALDCSRRCVYSKHDYELQMMKAEENGEETGGQAHTSLNHQEQICAVRCINKYMETKAMADLKCKGQI